MGTFFESALLLLKFIKVLISDLSDYSYKCKGKKIILLEFQHIFLRKQRNWFKCKQAIELYFFLEMSFST